MSDDLAAVIRALREMDDDSETRQLHDVATSVGDRFHGILKAEAMRLPSVRAAIGMAIHVTAQMLVETIQFGERSMGAGSDAEMVRAASLQFFIDLINAEFPGALARPN